MAETRPDGGQTAVAAPKYPISTDHQSKAFSSQQRLIDFNLK
jgi:hypothetical protein